MLLCKCALVIKSNFHRVVSLAPCRDTVFLMLFWFKNIPLTVEPTSYLWIATLGKSENSPYVDAGFRSYQLGFLDLCNKYKDVCLF